MKTKKPAIIILMMAALAVAVIPVKSFAAASTYTCAVNSAGPATELDNLATYKVAISLTWVSGGTKPATTTKIFYAPTGHEKEFLAVALAAIVNGKQVSAMVDFVTSASTTVYNLELLP
ncbi:MAG TPA: hypothetical protein VEF34_12475 [Syntrophobacteraceae bacterium]|nr:hypothetical protein [Syntrophobacteraceae bacterium]